MHTQQPSVIPYRLVRSDRRTLAILVDEHGQLIARAPKRMPARDIERFIEQKAGWIAAKQAEALARVQREPPLRLISGAALPYLGGTLTLALEPVRKPIMQGGVLTLPDSGEPAAHLRQWLTQEAERVLVPRVTEWARVTGLAPKRLKWSAARKRWGSMSTDGTLRLNLALLMCPMDAIDYVIVHELAHIPHPDHSPAFHALVRKVLPDAEKRRASMRDMAARLSVLGG